MTRREKILATTLLTLAVVLGGGILFHLFIYQPIRDVREQLAFSREQLSKKQNELNTEHKQIESILRLNPRLTQWQKLSLPPRDPEMKKRPGVGPEEQKKKHITELQVEYERYLSELMQRNGFRSDSVVVTPRQPDRRLAPPATPKGKEPIYERLAFGVTGRGTLENLVKALREFHSTTLLHQVRNLTVNLATGRSGRSAPSTGTLDVNLTVEALMVNGAEERSGLFPSKLGFQPRVLASTSRDYLGMDRRNMFIGIAPPPPPPTAPTEPPPGPSEDRNDVLRFVKLTMLSWNPNRKRWEATLYDQAKGGSETRLTTRLWNEFTVLDRYKNKAIEAKVMLIDERQLIFKADGKFYRMRCGDFLYPTIREELDKTELTALGLAPDS